MKHHSCPLCRSVKFQSLKNYESHFLHICHSCGFVFTGQIPDSSDLAKHYNGYGNYMDLSSITLKRFDNLLTDFSVYKKSSNILDFGCGEGFFLERARLKGWNVFGTEYDPEAIRKCREKGISMIQSTDTSFYGQFDVIYISEVIEHVSFPLDTLAVIRNFLRKGGAVYVTTPNFNSVSRFFVGNKWNIITYPEHLSYFTKSTLQKSLQLAGFKILTIKTQGISINRIKKSLNAGIQTTKKPIETDEKIRILAENNYLFNMLKGILNLMFRLTQKGDTIKCLAIKK